MPRGAKPGERRGGRVKGTPNRTTIERALKAEQDILKARATARPLAKERADEFMQLFCGMAATYQPIAPGNPIPEGRQPDEAKFEKYARLAMQMIAILMPFQSPKLSAIAIAAPAPDQTERRKVFQLTVFESTPRGATAEPVTIDGSLKH